MYIFSFCGIKLFHTIELVIRKCLYTQAFEMILCQTHAMFDKLYYSFLAIKECQDAETINSSYISIGVHRAEMRNYEAPYCLT